MAPTSAPIALRRSPRRWHSRRRARCGSDPALSPSTVSCAGVRYAHRPCVRRPRPTAPRQGRAVAPARTPAPAFRAEFEQPKIGRPEADVAIAAPNAPGQSIEIEVSDVESLGDPFRPAASEQRVHAGHQFDHRERLDDVVIRADRETAHPLRFFAPGGDHDDRQGAGRLARPQAPANLDARNARQHPVENEKIGRIFGQAQLGLVAARDAFHDVALGLQIVS